MARPRVQDLADDDRLRARALHVVIPHRAAGGSPDACHVHIDFKYTKLCIKGAFRLKSPLYVC